MTQTFFTADTHFGHGSIILYCRRPFMDLCDIDALLEYRAANEAPPSELKQRLEAATHLMNEQLVTNWNETVSPDDDVWHLGDFCHSNRVMADDFLRRLNGQKHLIRGNHDPVQTYGCRQWMFSKNYAEYKIEKTKLVFFHYPLRTWNGSFGGKALQLHGHCHGMLPPLTGQCDVGVDCWDYRPVTLAQIKERIESVS